MSEDLAESRTNEFLKRFMPPEAIKPWGYSPHRLLYDFKQEYHFSPTSAQLEECLRAYLKLLEEATSEEITGILTHHDFMDTSELVLAYLIRADPPQTLSIARNTRDQLVVLTDRIVSELRSFAGGMFDGDGVKRVVSINEHLKAWATE